MIPLLRVISGPAEGPSYLLTENEITVGREPSNQICIADPLISRRHCRIVKQTDQKETRYRLIDDNSINGLQVNGDQVKEHWLAHGDIIKIGKISLLFLCHEEAVLTSGENTVELEDEPSGQRPTVAVDRGKSRYLADNPLQSEISQETAESQLIQDFQKLLQIGLELYSQRDANSLQHRLFELIGEAVPAEHGAVILFNLGTNDIKSIHDWHRSQQMHVRFKVSNTILKQVLTEGKAILSNDVAANKELSRTESLIQSGIHSVLADPMVALNKTLGVIYLDTRKPASYFTSDHAHFVTAIADVAATAYTNARYVEQLQDEARRLKDELDFDREMIGESEPMITIRRFIAAFAPTNSTVLIRGDSGTGKEIVARAIHRNSLRDGKPFIAINCAVLAEGLLASELFGHERGAFTGAIATKKGKLELADGGTVFLDEIGELAPELQAKLLRVLQEREIERVGSTRSIKIDIRLIVATNKDLETAIESKEFRQDLFYRLNVFTLTMPPLRDRKSDIPLLAEFFVAKYASQRGRRVSGISSETSLCLMQYSWPGNVRELENVIERAVVLCGSDVIQPDDLPAEIVNPQSTKLSALTHQSAQQTSSINRPTFRDALKQAKKIIIQNAIENADGNLQLAAERLDIHVNNLHRHIRELGIKRKT